MERHECVSNSVKNSQSKDVYNNYYPEEHPYIREVPNDITIIFSRRAVSTRSI